MDTAMVLIVDDEPEVRDVLRDILENDGYTVVAVENGRAALEEAKRRNFDIAVIDYILPPPYSGLALIRVLCEQDPQLLSILITGYPTSELAELASREKVFRYITKPIHKSWLCSTVASALWVKHVREYKESTRKASE